MIHGWHRHFAARHFCFVTGSDSISTRLGWLSLDAGFMGTYCLGKVTWNLTKLLLWKGKSSSQSSISWVSMLLFRSTRKLSVFPIVWTQNLHYFCFQSFSIAFFCSFQPPLTVFEVRAPQLRYLGGWFGSQTCCWKTTHDKPSFISPITVFLWFFRLPGLENH